MNEDEDEEADEEDMGQWEPCVDMGGCKIKVR